MKVKADVGHGVREWSWKTQHGCIAVPRRRSESVDRASEPTAESEADTQKKERKYIQCAACLKDLVAGTLECFFCRSLLTYALDCQALQTSRRTKRI